MNTADRPEGLPVKILVVHRRDPHDVYVGRPSKWGNPFREDGKNTRLRAIQNYRDWILYGGGRHLLKDLHELRGKVLGCWCAPMPCHAEVLAELANRACLDCEPGRGYECGPCHQVRTRGEA